MPVKRVAEAQGAPGRQGRDAGFSELCRRVSDVAAHAELAHAHGIPRPSTPLWVPSRFPSRSAAARHSGRRGHPGDQHPQDGHRLHPVLDGPRAGGERIDLERLEAAFEGLHTTSPSGAIFASIDLTRDILAERGEDLLARPSRWPRERGHDSGRCPVWAWWAARSPSDPGLLMHDPTKIVLTLTGTGADGQVVADELEQRGPAIGVFGPRHLRAGDHDGRHRRDGGLPGDRDHRRHRAAPRPATAAGADHGLDAGARHGDDPARRVLRRPRTGAGRRGGGADRRRDRGPNPQVCRAGARERISASTLAALQAAEAKSGHRGSRTAVTPCWKTVLVVCVSSRDRCRRLRRHPRVTTIVTHDDDRTGYPHDGRQAG